jgi:hypoxanthine phosphoribosyltransferase
VDDVADRGETLALVLQLMGPHCVEARTAVLYAKPRSTVPPITFPWSALPPVARPSVT